MTEVTKIRDNEMSAIPSVRDPLHSPLLHLDRLLPLLQRLDQHLARAIAAVELSSASDAPIDLYRGLHVNLQEVERAIARQSDAKLVVETLHATSLQGEILPNFIPENSRLARLQQIYNLSIFDIETIAIALAPELDRRYDRLYAYLQNDARCKQPTIELALNLLCASAPAKLKQRDRFSPSAPLIRHKLLHLISDPNQSQASLLAQNLQLDEQVVRFLLGEKGLDSRLSPFCQLVQPAVSLSDLRLNESVKKSLGAIALQNQRSQQPLRLYFQGSDRSGKRRTAEALAAELQTPLLAADVAQIVATKVEFEPILRLIFREALFENALLYIDNLDILQGEERAIFYQELLNAIAQNQGITILSGELLWKPGIEAVLGLLTIPFSVPDFALRRQEWQDRLTEAGISISDSDLDALSDRFRLTCDRIADAVATAWHTAQWQVASGERNSISEAFFYQQASILFAAARAQSGHALTALARKIEPKYQWEDIVLTADSQTQIREICNQAKHRHLIYDEWGFDRKLSLGKGQNVLFSGPPGTGKTMAAEVIARELQLDLYKIDLSQIVSKYIGETEKNLNRIFNAAGSSNAILFFDEADSLFGKRTEVKESHDRYANIEVGYLLQKMEEYEGIAILTTNARSNIDDAFVRRLRFIVEFPLPKEKDRRRIWEKTWPDATPRSPDLDFDFLARRFEISGANIRNIVLAAAFLAAEDGAVNMSHLIRATRREYQKMGKILMEEEFGNYAGVR